MLFRNHRLKKIINKDLDSVVSLSLSGYSVVLGRTMSVYTLASWISYKGRMTTGSVIEELEDLILRLVKSQLENKNFLYIHEELANDGLLPNFNYDLASYFSNTHHIKTIVTSRITALILDKFLKSDPKLANMSCLNFLKFIGEDTNVLFEPKRKKEGHYKRKQLLNEICVFSRKLYLLFRNSEIDIKIKFKNGYDYDNQFKFIDDYDFNYNEELSFFNNFREMIENPDEILETLSNNPLMLKVDKSLNSFDDSFLIHNLNIDFENIDAVFVPLKNDVVSSNLTPIIFSDYFDDVLIFGAYSPTNDSIPLSDEIYTLANEINSELITE